MPYDYQKLLGTMREKGYTQESLAKAINISTTSLNLKLKNRREFRQNEIQQIYEVLELPFESIADYFFTPQA